MLCSRVRVVGRALHLRPPRRAAPLLRGASLSTVRSTTEQSSTVSLVPLSLLGVASAWVLSSSLWQADTITQLETRPNESSWFQVVDPSKLGPVTEPSTGIVFPELCNGMILAGTGVRFKYGFVKVYAVATYLDPDTLLAVKKKSESTPEAILLNPKYFRTIKIVMNRSLSSEKFISAIVEALEPRMKGQDMDKLAEFKTLMPPLELAKGSELHLTIRGDTLLFRNALGGVSAVHSEILTKALCDVYYGSESVSPTHKQAVLKFMTEL